MRRLVCAFKAWERRRAIDRSLAQAYVEVVAYLDKGDRESAMIRLRWWADLLLERHGAWWVDRAPTPQP